MARYTFSSPPTDIVARYVEVYCKQCGLYNRTSFAHRGAEEPASEASLLLAAGLSMQPGHELLEHMSDTFQRLPEKLKPDREGVVAPAVPFGATYVEEDPSIPCIGVIQSHCNNCTYDLSDTTYFPTYDDGEDEGESSKEQQQEADFLSRCKHRKKQSGKLGLNCTDDDKSGMEDTSLEQPISMYSERGPWPPGRPKHHHRWPHVRVKPN
ncbi:hypothetical protein PG990_005155 [Apiospora arundinis]